MRPAPRPSSWCLFLQKCIVLLVSQWTDYVSLSIFSQVLHWCVLQFEKLIGFFFWFLQHIDKKMKAGHVSWISCCSCKGLHSKSWQRNTKHSRTSRSSAVTWLDFCCACHSIRFEDLEWAEWRHRRHWVTWLDFCCACHSIRLEDLEWAEWRHCRHWVTWLDFCCACHSIRFEVWRAECKDVLPSAGTRKISIPLNRTAQCKALRQIVLGTFPVLLTSLLQKIII